MNGSAPSKLRPAAYAGLALGAASAAPVLNLANCACCSLVILGGFLASYLYLKGAPPTAGPPYGDVAVVGLLAGLIGAVVTAVLSLPMAFLGAGMGMWTAMQEVVSDAGLPEPFQNLFATAGAGTLAVGMVLVSFVLNLFVYGLFSTLGALLGAAVLQRRPPVAPAAAAPPMPPPPLAPPPTDPPPAA